MLAVHALHLGPLDNNTYLVVNEATRETAVVDVGFEAEVVIREIERRKLDVKLLLNTHAHYDHVSGMRAVQRVCGGEYHLHPADRPLLEHLAEQGAAFGFPPAEPPEHPHDLTDRQKITLAGETIDVIHTPGHSPGGVCFRHGDWVIVGDTLFAGSIGRTDLPGGDHATLIASIRTVLFSFGDDAQVHPGHGPSTTIGRERRTNPFLVNT